MCSGASRASAGSRPKPEAPPLKGMSASPQEDPEDGPAGWRARLKPVKKNPAERVLLAEPRTGEALGKAHESSKGPVHVSPTPLLPDKTVDAARPPPSPSVGKPLGSAGVPSSPGKAVTNATRLPPNYMPPEEIQRQMQDIESQLDALELKGVELEKNLRAAEGDASEDALMADWFQLIHEKQLLLRQESELMYKARDQRLVEQQMDLEGELRQLMAKPSESCLPQGATASGVGGWGRPLPGPSWLPGQPPWQRLMGCPGSSLSTSSPGCVSLARALTLSVLLTAVITTSTPISCSGYTS